MGPIDYSLQGIQSPAQALMQGVQFGAGLSQLQAQRQAAEAQAAAQQAAINRQQQFQGALQSFFANPNRKFEDLEGVLPFADKQQFEGLKLIAERMDKRTGDASKQFYGQLLAAIEFDPAQAKTMLDQRIEAEPNPQNKQALTVARNSLEIDPEMAANSIELIGGASFGKDWYESISKVREQRRAAAKFPFELVESEARANKAAVESKYAESKAVLDLQKAGWDITKLQNDIEVSRQNSAIALMNAQLGRESNDLKRQELQAKLQEAQDKRDSTIREKAADLEAARMNVDNMLNTATRILRTPRPVINAATGPISVRIPTTSAETADFEALVETLGSQSFLAQIPNIKGMGQLSNAEGEKLQAALQNFSLKQSPERLMENVREAQRLLSKARGNMSARAGLPESPPDVPAAAVAVRLPDGQVFNFPSQQAADAFKRRAGIQ